MAEEFIMDHFGADPRRRMCRTGALVSRRADDLVEIAGDPNRRTGPTAKARRFS
jgi:hypothetical protein